MSTYPLTAAPLLPLALTAVGTILSQRPHASVDSAWRPLIHFCSAAVAGAVLIACFGIAPDGLAPYLRISPLASWCAVLVQLLGTVIACFSARYLDGEREQRTYVLALGSVLSAVQLLLLADHWLVLIGAWALISVAMRPLLCSYKTRPFAQLAGHKKWIADRAADVLLISAAAISWQQTGNGTLPALWNLVEREGMSMPVQLCALCVALAVVLRAALFPVHGWLIQVMEAPTPVSALLHAGVVNLGGFVLIRFSPLLDHALPARVLLVAFGLGTAVLAGCVMLTRISIKVRLAWSTVAQMGFMVLECGVGLYALAALHLVGHSLYKAHAFLSSSDAVRQARRQTLCASTTPSRTSMVFAPAVALAIVFLVHAGLSHEAWPWWWRAVMGLAWAPLLWLPVGSDRRTGAALALSGFAMVTVLATAASLAHVLPFGLRDAPIDLLGVVSLAGMIVLYLFLASLQAKPHAFETWRRWAYAGFYIDEIYTRLALRFGRPRWMPKPHAPSPQVQVALASSNVIN